MFNSCIALGINCGLIGLIMLSWMRLVRILILENIFPLLFKFPIGKFLMIRLILGKYKDRILLLFKFQVISRGSSSSLICRKYLLMLLLKKCYLSLVETHMCGKTPCNILRTETTSKMFTSAQLTTKRDKKPNAKPVWTDFTPTHKRYHTLTRVQWIYKYGKTCV